MTLCYHRNVTDRVKYAIDDPPSVWVCLDCGDEFPLIGDTDQWKPKEIKVAKEPANPLLEDDWEEISTGIGEEWDFDKSGALIGTYKGTEYVDIPEEKQRPNDNGEIRTRAMTYKFLTASDGSEVFVWESYQLNEAMKEVSEGELCKLEFDGYKQFSSGSGQPRQVKKFKVSVKRK